MTKAKLDFLEVSMQSRRLIRFSRKFEEGTVLGYVLDIGPKFFLLALVSDRIYFDGFECFRISDLITPKSNPHVKFVESALKFRGENLPEKPPVDLSSIQKLLISASVSFPLITIHRENIDPDVCHIGQVLNISRGLLSLREIDPDAEWDERPGKYRIGEITRVNFGGGYENALFLIGGDPGPIIGPNSTARASS